jgi:two-component system chemotaxis sensor kinase CheA
VKNNTEHRIEHIKDTPVLRLRNKLLPLIHSAGCSSSTARTVRSRNGFIVVTQDRQRRLRYRGRRASSTRRNRREADGDQAASYPSFSGNTILGDGSVIMIFDPNGVAKRSALTQSRCTQGTCRRRDAGHVDSKTSLLVFRAGSHEAKAVPLALVTRLEESRRRRSKCRAAVIFCNIEVSSCRWSGERRRQDQGWRHAVAAGLLGWHALMALVVDEIVDIVEDVLKSKSRANSPVSSAPR